MSRKNAVTHRGARRSTRRSTDRRPAPRRAPLLMTSAVLAVVLAGCSGPFPRDPDGTLDQVRGGELRVGVSASEPWTQIPDPQAEPQGLEADLVRAFAADLDAEIVWTTGGEEELIGDLERSELDLVIGGLTAESPWASHAALTYPYTTTTDPEGKPEKHVMAAPLGENAFLVELETFLLDTAKDVQP